MTVIMSWWSREDRTRVSFSTRTTPFRWSTIARYKSITQLYLRQDNLTIDILPFRGEYDHIGDGYALLGTLTLPLENGAFLHYLVLVTQCTSVGKLDYSWLSLC